ncbi:MAG: hypothetical protein ACRD96_10730 [Bryobacteraceae bacterium]
MPDYPPRLRLWMLLLNLFPFAHTASLAALAWYGHAAAFALALYVAPPLLARAVRLAVAIPQGRVPVASGAFLGWWATAQFQMLFNRFPLLEEALRLVPGLYSAWLRLWGSRIGRLTYWAPGTAVLDRSYLHLGDDVVFGAGVRLNGHVLVRNPGGQLELVLGTIRIGDASTVGGYCLLTAGTEVAAGESTRACLLSPPFTLWKDGKRTRIGKEIHD